MVMQGFPQYKHTSLGVTDDYSCTEEEWKSVKYDENKLRHMCTLIKICMEPL